MADALPVLRLRVPCADEADFRRKVALVAKNGTFVPTAAPRPLGARLVLELEQAGGAAVERLQVEVSELSPGKGGMRVRPSSHVEEEILTGETEELPPASPKAVAPKPRADPQPQKLVSMPGTGTRVDERGLLKPHDTLGGYQILMRLGGGGMADVYLAVRELSEGVDKLVALKTVLPAFGPNSRFRGMFLDEARIGATLHHPNVVQVFDFGESGSRPYLAMEYMHGRDLNQLLARLRQENRLPPVAFAVAVGIELCRGLEYVHGLKDLAGKPLNLVHRDISPGNVLVTTRSELKLMDFGVAAGVGNTSEQEGLVLGKLSYMSVQQAMGQKPKPAWDIFAVGAVLYELACLRRASTGKPEDFHKPRIPPSHYNKQIPEELERLILGALDPDEARRPPSMEAFRAALEQIQLDVGRFEIGGLIEAFFGPELKRQQAEVEAAIGEARRRAANVSALTRLERRFRKRALQRPRLTAAVGLIALLALGGLGALRFGAISAERALLEKLAGADARAASGHLVGPGGDQALDWLLAAERLAPHDARVTARREAFAARFELLGRAALSRGDLAEAAAQLEAAQLARPSPELKQALAEVETKVKESGRARVSHGH